MGVDCYGVLPFGVRLNDVVAAIAQLAGCAKTSDYKKHPSGYERLKYESGTVCLDLINIEFTAKDGEKFFDGETWHSCWFSFNGRDGHPEVRGKSNSFWVAMIHRLVEFFGGSFILSDVTDEVTYQKKATISSKSFKSDTDDKYYRDQQKRIAKLRLDDQLILWAKGVNSYAGRE